MKYPYMKNADLKLKNLCKKGINSLYKVEDRNYAFAYLEKELAIIARQGSASMWIMVFNALEAVGAKTEDIYERLKLYGIDEITAYEIADYVRRGDTCCYGFTCGMLEVMNRAGVPQWFISSCEKISSLISRGESVVACYDIEEDSFALAQFMK